MFFKKGKLTKNNNNNNNNNNYKYEVDAGLYEASSMPHLIWSVLSHRCWHLFKHGRWMD